MGHLVTRELELNFLTVLNVFLHAFKPFAYVFALLVNDSTTIFSSPDITFTEEVVIFAGM